jgi:hypothetical protein
MLRFEGANDLKVQTSCGFGVPLLAMRPDSKDPSKQEPYFHDRDTLGHWAGKQISAGTIHEYQAKNNNSSLDGLPGLRAARRDKGERLWYRDMKIKLRRNSTWQMVVVALLSSLMTIFSMQILGLTTIQIPLVQRLSGV